MRRAYRHISPTSVRCPRFRCISRDYHSKERASQGVWASKYNERALLSMRKVGLDFRDLRMAVLVQRVVPAAYAFVIHTHNPATGAANEASASPMP